LVKKGVRIREQDEIGVRMLVRMEFVDLLPEIPLRVLPVNLDDFPVSCQIQVDGIQTIPMIRPIMQAGSDEYVGDCFVHGCVRM
jgi:hypothetical protein